MNRKVLCLIAMIPVFAFGQGYTHADTLRGSNGPGRSWWDATKYDLSVKFNIGDSTISGYNTISFKPTGKNGASFMQIDLQEPLIVDSVTWILPGGQTTPVAFRQEGNAWFLDFPANSGMIGKFKKKEKYNRKKVKTKITRTPNHSDISQIMVFYHGKPRVAKHPPWDGGLIWTHDKNDHDWVTIACQGLGASVWYPCKDYQGDEPDSASMDIIGPSGLVAVSNGRMREKVSHADGTTTTTWAVVNPINNYDFIPYLGKYVHFGEIYDGEKGPLTMDYWVIDSNLAKAKVQFKDAPRMMKAFEYWFGPYPFYEDGYKLVDAPHLGMEHQSAVAYGNGYQNGYYGKDLSESGWGDKFDFIIVHESGHEWFGNNITTRDIADSWVHEGFTSYSESLFLEYYYGKEASTAYVTGIRSKIENKKPIIGDYGVNADGPIDIYYKAHNMLHTIRQVIDNDSLFRQILRGLNKTFYHQTITSKDVENYIGQRSGKDLSKIFDQYLRTTKVPTLVYSIINNDLRFKWENVVPGFAMPVKVMMTDNKYEFIYPEISEKNIPFPMSELKVDPNFYIESRQVNQ